MKSNQKITRVKLKMDHDEDFILLGLVSAEPDYKLSLSVNKKVGISLKNVSPIRIEDDNGQVITFSRFSYLKSSPETTYNLISNRSGTNFLLKRLRNIDYILQVHDSEKLVSADTLTIAMREIESVNAVFNIETSSFKDKNLHYITH